MQFRTDFNIIPHSNKLTYQNSIFSIGSCFADRMGEKLHFYKFSTLVNPFGVIFNPVSICNLLKTTLNNKVNIEDFIESGLIRNQENIWHHYAFHSELADLEKEKLVHKLTDSLKQARVFLQKADFLIITLGTAWVYERVDTKEIVANCHKISAAHFNKRLLQTGEISEAFKTIEPFLKDKQIILTVSPVRHIKDTIPLNTVSKAVLRLTCHELEEKYEYIRYFPSYELMMDDLRDYRFYKEDMLHPTIQAEDYIWEKFVDICITGDTQQIMQKWEKIARSLAHKPFNAHSEAHQKFLRKTQTELEQISKYINVQEEIQVVQNLILNK